MKHCRECNIDIDTNRVTCPFCRDILDEKNNEKTKMESYESYKESPYKNHTVRKIFLFISLIAIFVCVLVNFLTFSGSFWSLFVVGGIFYLWILIRFTIMSRQNIALKLLLQAIGIGLILFFIQIENRSVHWLMPYALPFMMVATTLAITLLIFIKIMRYKDYMLYLIMVALLGIIPLILCFVETTQYLFMVGDKLIIWPSIVCCSYAGFTILGMFVFGERATKAEFIKRFHV